MSKQNKKNTEIYTEINDLRVYETNENEIHKKFDSFLDSYSLYMADKSFLPKSILKRKIIELELIDPSFDFELDD